MDAQPLRKLVALKKPFLAANLRLDGYELERLPVAEQDLQRVKNSTSGPQLVDAFVRLFESADVLTYRNVFQFVADGGGGGREVALVMLRELEMALGQLPVEEHVLCGAGLVVHRRLGTSKRFSETEKRVVTELIGQRVQVTSAVCCATLAALDGDVEQRRRKRGDVQRSVDAICSVIENFMRERCACAKTVDPTSLRHDRMTDALLYSIRGPKRSALRTVRQLDQPVNAIQNALATSLLETAQLLQERNAACALLDAPNDIEELDKQMAEAIFNTSRRQHELESFGDELTRRSGEIGSEMQKSDVKTQRELGELRRRLDEKRNSERQLNDELEEQRRVNREKLRKLRQLQRSVENFRLQFVVLDRSKRLGQIYQRFGETNAVQSESAGNEHSDSDDAPDEVAGLFVWGRPNGGLTM